MAWAYGSLMGDLKLGRLVAVRFKTPPFQWALRDSDLSRSGKALPSSFLASSVILAFLTCTYSWEVADMVLEQGIIPWQLQLYCELLLNATVVSLDFKNSICFLPISLYKSFTQWRYIEYYVARIKRMVSIENQPPLLTPLSRHATVGNLNSVFPWVLILRK